MVPRSPPCRSIISSSPEAPPSDEPSLRRPANLVPVTLELGGKSPAIVAKGHVQDQTVADIVFGKLLSGGQTCIAPDYALVHQSEIDTFIESYDRLVKPPIPTARRARTTPRSSTTRSTQSAPS
jgi:acyl-CoA reductase-like NAD-dependent aldehyde dehydrogenase